jgi:hypothetical protein
MVKTLMKNLISNPFEEILFSLLPNKYQKALLLMELGYALSNVIKDSVAIYAHPDTIDTMSEEKIDEFFTYLESVATNLKEFTEQLPAEVEK